MGHGGDKKKDSWSGRGERMKTILIFMFLVGIAGAVSGPAGVVLDGQKVSVPVIDLRNVDPVVFNATAFDNGPLGDPHYFSEVRIVKQDDTPTDMSLMNWSNEWVEIPDSFVRN